MEHQAMQCHNLWPLAVYVAAVLLLAVTMIGLSYILGERHTGRSTGEPYESGLMPTGAAWIRFDVKYYLIAMFFVIFDLESIFIFAWGVAVREAGWSGYLAIVIFIVILMAALFYLWRMGALDWGTLKQKR
ncbi:MAG TPA: NADH-quinone oxidoreductase subunit A [Syntrophales bacterium]|nr:NADH-quinone oxidoreductase subunit A [Syntrophales bacterium]